MYILLKKSLEHLHVLVIMRKTLIIGYFLQAVAVVMVNFIFFVVILWKDMPTTLRSQNIQDRIIPPTIHPVHIEPYTNDILLTPRTYHSKYLHKWQPAPPVPNITNGVGEMGKPVYLQLEEAEAEAKKRFKEHEFNIVVSDLISANRSLPDSRNPQCLEIKYQSKLPKTSIIFIIHNEAWSTLLRSLWSIINRSPKELVKEILIVDDQSTFDFLGDQLDEYVRTLPIHTRVLRMDERLGIVRARLRGAESAQGEVLTFLDSHIECIEGWLEPLLSRITENRRIVTIPFIDTIRENSFEHAPASGTQWGGFSWKLLFQWVMIPERERNRTENSKVAPLYTPTMAGGLFSIDKEFFYEIGSYDRDMIIWGSENLEMSFRIWMCGGILELIPCSRVSHVFRKNAPYKYPDGKDVYIRARNKRRLAEVWLDDWLSFYDAINPDQGNTSAGDVSDRIALRKKLNCKNFQWYVDTIYPEVDLYRGRKYIGQIQNEDSKNCVTQRGIKEGILQSCNRAFTSQVFVLTNIDEIRNNNLCLDAVSRNGSVKFLKCHKMRGNQKWAYDEQKKTIVHNSGSCLQRDIPNEPWLNVKKCDGSNRQQWLLIGK